MSGAGRAVIDMRPVAERFAARCENVEDLIRRIRQGEDDPDLMTQLNLDSIRVARLALLVRDEKVAKKK